MPKRNPNEIQLIISPEQAKIIKIALEGHAFVSSRCYDEAQLLSSMLQTAIDDDEEVIHHLNA